MSTPDSNRNAAERLKLLANKLHQNGEYQGAYAKYSEAIQKDPANAVLYANRAASSLALKKYGAFFV
jgi:tetratricopeptide (TPR) repeat protein